MSFLYRIKAIPITDYAQKCGFTLVRKGQRYVSLKEHDSVMIDISKNCFWRNSVFKKGMHGGTGSVIDFAMEFMGYEQNKALRELAIMYDISGDDEVSNQKEAILSKNNTGLKIRENQLLELPAKANNTRAVFHYLVQKRGIDLSVVRYFVAKQMLYQEAKYSNCVFVSYKFACMRSTRGKRFVIDVRGCDYNECFFFRPSSKARTLIVAESVIDIMSIMTLFVKEKKRYIAYAYLALTGTNKLASLFYHLNKEQDIDHIMLAFDNDEAGEVAQEAACRELRRIGYTGKVEIFKAPMGKDWNDYIRNIGDGSSETISSSF